MINIDGLLEDGLIIQRKLLLDRITWTENWNESILDDPDTEPVSATDASRTYAEIVLASEPIHYYRLSDTGATEPDLGSANETGAYGGTYLNSSDKALTNDEDAYAMKFSSTGRMLYDNQLGGAVLGTIYKDVTFEFWVKIDGTIDTAKHKFISGRQSYVPYMASDGQFVVFRRASDGKYFVQFGVPQHLAYAYTPYGYPANLDDYFPKAEINHSQWYHVVGTIDKNGKRSIYVNGSLRSTAKTSAQHQSMNRVSTGSAYIHHIPTHSSVGADFVAVEQAVLPTSIIVDEFAVYDEALSIFTIQRHYLKGKDLYDRYEAERKGLKNQIQHHWKMEEASGASRISTNLDNPLPLLSNATVTRNTGKVGSYAAEFAYASNNYLNAATEPSLELGAENFTIGFWVYMTDKSRNYTFVQKRHGAAFKHYEAGYKQSTDKFIFTILDDTGTTHTAFEHSTGPTLNTWHFILASYDKDADTMSIQIDNGTVETQGVALPIMVASTGDLIVGATLIGGTTSMSGRIDSLSIWKRSLLDWEAGALYNDGNGLDYADFGDYEAGTNYRPLPYLRGPTTDVTGYVTSYNIVKDANQLVDACEIQCAEDWGVEVIGTIFVANTYLRIQERYINKDYTVDTGFHDVGHFLIEGVSGESINANGEKVINVAAKGMLKLASLDKANGAIEPDKILVSRRDMLVSDETAETKTYQVERAGMSGVYYENWADSPSVRIWATDFPPLPGDEVLAGDILRLRGSEGATQVLFGAGKLILDKDYLTSAVKDNGFGNPSTIQAEFFRFAQDVDVIDSAKITNITRTLDNAGNIVVARLRIADTTIGYASAESYIGRTVYVTSGNAKGYSYIIRKVLASAPHVYFYVSRADGTLPDFNEDQLAVNDYVRITDDNAIEVALTKALKRAGFQDLDPTLPFYVDIDPPAIDGGVLVPPIRFSWEDEITWLDVITNIMQFAPPNYVLYQDNSGVMRTKTVIQKEVESADHNLLGITDYFRDRSDFGVYTRVVVVGGEGDSTNVALHVDQGGNADIGAYKLTNFYLQGSETGQTKSQANANLIMDQINNADPKTPSFTDTSTNDIVYYGGIYNMNGDSCKRWSMEDSDILWLDLGINPVTENMYELDQINLTVLPPFINGTIFKQSMQIYYMTDDDYIALANARAPLPGSSTYDATTKANLTSSLVVGAASPAWKLLVDEFNCEEGETVIPSDQFEGGRPKKFRFLKFRVCQPYHRPKQDVTPYRNVPISIISLNDIKVYTSRRIIQTAELGKTPPFDTADFKSLKARLRRRTYVLRDNPYLDTVKKVQDFASQELKERYTEFSPYNFTAVAPTVDIYDTIKFINPNNNITYTAVVKALSHKHDGTVNITAVDYSIY